MEFQDRVSIERVRRLSDGRLAAVARFARSGVYQYSGREVGRPELTTVNVYRPESEVFSEDAMASFAHKTLTLDHPSESVNAKNWKRVAVGYTEGRVARDGGFVEIPLMVADADAVQAVESGAAKELSAGYQCDLVWEDGVAPSGERYQAKQVKIRGDHIAIVGKGRAGPDCRIGDGLEVEDSSLANANAIRALTGRSPLAANSKAQAIADQVALDHAEKVRANDTAVQAAIERYASRSKITVDNATLAPGAAIRDAARQAQYHSPTGNPPAAATRAEDETRLTAGAAVRDAARAAAYGR